MKKINYSGNYSSTNSFVSENKLEKEADKVFGKNWEADDDINQIQKLLDSIGEEYVVKHIEEKTKRDSRVDDYIEVSKKENEEEVTADDVLFWHGSDHTIEELAQVLADVVNGKYDSNLCKKEIINMK